MSELGAHALVSALATSRKAIQLYPPAHPSYGEALGSLVATVSELTLQQGQFVLNLHQGHLYAGSEVIPDDPAVTATAEAFEARKIESLTFHDGFGKTDAAGLAEVLNLRASQVLDVKAELAVRGVSGVTVSELVDDDAEEKKERDRRREADRALYRQLIAALRALSSKLASGQTASVAEADGVVHGVMDRLMEDRSAMLALATMRSHNEADLYHGINVMIYSLTLGSSLGLPDEGLASLGVSGLLHDVGKAAFDAKDPAQAQAMYSMHPQVGADILAQLPDEDRTAMLVAYEHHMYPDGSGHPERQADYVPHPYSRMVAVANRYENLTKPSDNSIGITPDRAVKMLLREAGTKLDPLFARLFVKALGVFPVGCMVRLSDDSVGVVCDSEEDLLLPKVRVLFDPRGTKIEEPAEVDLREDGRTVVEVVEPEALNVEVSDEL